MVRPPARDTRNIRHTSRANYARPDVSVDIVLLTLLDRQLHVALHVRPNAPEAGRLALPGGYVHVDDETETDVHATALRVLREKVGLTPRYIEQLRTYSGPTRDARSWTVAVSHVALVPHEELGAAGKDVFHYYPVDGLPKMAFDHATQVRDAVERVRNKSSYSTLPCWLLPERFTLTQLQRTYEQIFGEVVTRSTFRRRLGVSVKNVQPGEAVDEAGFLIATDQMQLGNQRPARLFRIDQLGLYKRASW